MNQSDIEARIKLLERQNRWLRFGFLGIACGLAGLLLLGAAAAQNQIADVLRARKIVLVDGDGKEIASLAPLKEGGAKLFMRDGEDMVSLRCSDKDSSLMIWRGALGASMMVTDEASLVGTENKDSESLISVATIDGNARSVVLARTKENGLSSSLLTTESSSSVLLRRNANLEWKQEIGADE